MLPKDPMATDDSDDLEMEMSENEHVRQKIEKKLSEMPKPDYKLPQNVAPPIGDTFFADQAVNA